MGTQVMHPFLGVRLRVTRLDFCGRPVYGPCSTAVTSCFTTVALSPEVEEGNTIAPPCADGTPLFTERLPDRISYIGIEAAFNAVDPDMFTLLNTTWKQELDDVGNVIGFRGSTKLTRDEGFALEIWSQDHNAADICDDPNAQGAWDYLLLPRVASGAIGDLEIGPDALQFTLNGTTQDNPRWGLGVYDVYLDSEGDPSPLYVPIASDDPFLFSRTSLAPPEPTEGCQPLSNPAGPVIASLVEGDTNMEATLTATLTGGRPAQVNWGDGTAPAAVTTGTPVDHTYATPGTYVVEVKYTNLGQEPTYRVLTIPFP